MFVDWAKFICVGVYTAIVLLTVTRGRLFGCAYYCVADNPSSDLGDRVTRKDRLRNENV